MTWMITTTGRQFFIAQPEPDAICIDDIAHQLALSNRFNGATYRPYSVAEHSLLVAEIAERDLGLRDPCGVLAALMHDAHEAYFGDVISPVKAALGEAGRFVESRLERAVQRRYGLITPTTAYRELIRRADLMALATERRDLTAPHSTPWSMLTGIEPAGWVNLHDRDAFDWRDWRQAFADRFHELNFRRVQLGAFQSAPA